MRNNRATSEFGCIKQIIQQLQVHRDDTLVRSGDDCAVMEIPPGYALAVSIDTMVEGRHFLPTVSPRDLGYKLLAVNLSDLAAMAAKPAWVTIAMTTPTIDMDWISEFLVGFNELQTQYNVELIGSDLTKGPLTLTCEIHGLVQPQKIVQRSGANVGDLICVTGNLGGAAYAVANANCSPESRMRLNRPTPRVNEANVCQPWMTAAIDISDGLIADLNHICEMSSVGAHVNAGAIPLAPELGRLPNSEDALQYALTGGDDYELCFTVKNEHDFYQCQQAVHAYDCELTCIGTIVAGTGVQVFEGNERQ